MKYVLWSFTGVFPRWRAVEASCTVVYALSERLGIVAHLFLARAVGDLNFDVCYL